MVIPGGSLDGAVQQGGSALNAWVIQDPKLRRAGIDALKQSEAFGSAGQVGDIRRGNVGPGSAFDKRVDVPRPTELFNGGIGGRAAERAGCIAAIDEAPLAPLAVG